MNNTWLWRVYQEKQFYTLFLAVGVPCSPPGWLAPTSWGPHAEPAAPTQSPQHPHILSFLQSWLLLEWLLPSPEHLGHMNTEHENTWKETGFSPCLRGNKSHGDVQFRFCCRAELSLPTPPPPQGLGMKDSTNAHFSISCSHTPSVVEATPEAFHLEMCCLIAKSCLTLLQPRGLLGFLSMGFPRQEYWGGLPFPLPGDLPDPGIEPSSPAWQADSLPLSHLGSLVSMLAMKN